MPVCPVLAPYSSSKLPRADVAVVNSLTISIYRVHAGAEEFPVEAENLVWQSCTYSTYSTRHK